jgi:hypothetical protein
MIIKFLCNLLLLAPSFVYFLTFSQGQSCANPLNLNSNCYAQFNSDVNNLTTSVNHSAGGCSYPAGIPTEDFRAFVRFTVTSNFTGDLVVHDVNYDSEIAIWLYSNEANFSSTNCMTGGTLISCNDDDWGYVEINDISFRADRDYFLFIEYWDTYRLGTANEIVVDIIGGNCNSGGVLPVVLSSFEVSLLGEEAHISWISNSEINNAYYQVQRSSNLRDWEDVIMIPGAGNSSTEIFYETVDKNPLQETSYYRLKQVDFDGTETIHETKSITKSSLFVYPNPTKSDFTIVLPSLSNSTSVAIYDVHGKCVLTEYVSKEKRKVTLSSETFENGIYFIHFENEVHKLIVQH